MLHKVKMQKGSVAMTNITRPLTATQILNAQPKAKEYNLYDGGGLSLLIKPIGSKFWLFNYQRPITKKRVNLYFWDL